MRRRLARSGLLTAVLFLLASATTVAATPDADARFAALSQRYVTELGRHAPVSATSLGDHRFDAELDDLSAEGRRRSVAWARELLGELDGIDRAALSRANQVDAAMLDNQLRYSVWIAEAYRDWSWDPLGVHPARRPGAVRPAGA